MERTNYTIDEKIEYYEQRVRDCVALADKQSSGFDDSTTTDEVIVYELLQREIKRCMTRLRNLIKDRDSGNYQNWDSDLQKILDKKRKA